MNQPYIGVTGFMHPLEVSFAISCFDSSVYRKLMVGVLVSWKSLRNIPLKSRWKGRYPDRHMISSLFSNNRGVLNLVHYNTEKGEESSLADDMINIHNLAGKNFHGFQLNIPWPEIQSLNKYRSLVGSDFKIILQISKKAMEIVGNTPEGLTRKLSYYIGVIDGILLDYSGGYGRLFDLRYVYRLLFAVKNKGWSISLGVAGGLGPNSLSLIEPLVAEFPDLSIDAEGKLRDSENNLDLKTVKEYLDKASQIFKRKSSPQFL